MGLEHQLLDSAMSWGADYFGIADLSPARDAILEQGGTEIAAYARSISIGIALLHPVVDQLSRRPERAGGAKHFEALSVPFAIAVTADEV